MRIETMLNSMDAVGEILIEVRTLVRDVLEDGELDGIDKNDFTEIKMDQLESFLNVKMNGRFLFSGTKTDTRQEHLHLFYGRILCLIQNNEGLV